MAQQSTSKSLRMKQYCAACNTQLPTSSILELPHTSTKNNYNGHDHRLKSWGKVIQERNKVSKNIANITKRTTADLVMNTVEKVRELNEKKSVLEYSQIKVKASLRGSLWEQPLRLGQKCCCKPVYEQQRTKAEMGKIPEIEYVGVPENIQKEKGIIGPYSRMSCKYVGFENSKYKAQRENELSEEILQVEPYRPILKNLMVKGNKSRPSTSKKQNLPVIFVTECESSCKQFDSIHAVRINNTVFIKDDSTQNLDYLKSLRTETWHEEKTAWTYYFNVPVSQISKHKFKLINMGTVMLRYCWQAVKSKLPRSLDLIDDQVFFFNKNEDIVAPGQTREVVFIFISTAAGMFEEIWNFDVCSIDYLDPKPTLTITLIADAVESNLKLKEREIQKLTCYIAIQEKNYAVRSIIEEIVSKSTIVLPPPCPYDDLIIEENIFLMKNSDCYYHQTEVGKLKAMYSNIVYAGPWDLSLRTLRMAIIKLKFEERMEKYEILKNSHSVLLRPWEEGLTLSNQKHAAMKQQLGQFIDLFFLESLRLRQEYIRSKRFSPSRSEQLTIDIHIEEKTHKELFLMTMKAHFADIIEISSALLSSLDLFRRIEFEW